jgi:hypothetical protein
VTRPARTRGRRPPVPDIHCLNGSIGRGFKTECS